MSPAKEKISAATVRADFNDLTAVIHYARAAHDLGLWASEQLMIERHFPDRSAPLLEAGCGAGRVTLGLWGLGYRNLTAFDFADELLDQARSLAAERGADTGPDAIRFLQADATALSQSNLMGYFPPPPASAANHPLGSPPAPTPSAQSNPLGYFAPGASPTPNNPSASFSSAPPSATASDQSNPVGYFRGALFLFNGLMQIPGREQRRAALRELHRVCAPGAPLLFTTHDRHSSSTERALWRLEAIRWERGEQDPRLLEFGDRYFEEAGTGRTFMHLPDRAEILGDLAATGWTHVFDAMRSRLARESSAVRAFSDECRFWVAHRG